jgi:hypothetical protein
MTVQKNPAWLEREADEVAAGSSGSLMAWIAGQARR